MFDHFTNAFSGNSTPSAEDKLVERVRKGDGAAFEAIFRLYYTRLCKFVFHIVGSPAAAGDLVEDLFVKLWEGRKEWSPEGSLRTYLYKAAKNQALNYLKHQSVVRSWQREMANGMLLHEFGPEEELHQKELMNAIHHAIALLPERCRLIFVLHRQHGMTYREIAKVLDISVKTVETQMGRALKALRQILRPYLPVLSFLLLTAK